MRARVVVRNASLAMMVTAAACASSSGARPSGCASDLSLHPRSLNEVMDSVRLAADLIDAWYARSGLILAEVPYDSIGAVDSVRVMGERMPTGTRELLQRVVERHVPPRGDPRSRVHLVLGDGDGASPRRVRELRVCPPSLTNTDHVRDLIAAEARRFPLETRAVVRLYVRVLPDGSVGEVRIAQRSTNVAMDAVAVRIMREARFEPGRTEGIPVDVWASFPVTFIPEP